MIHICLGNKVFEEVCKDFDFLKRSPKMCVIPKRASESHHLSLNEFQINLSHSQNSSKVGRMGQTISVEHCEKSKELKDSLVETHFRNVFADLKVALETRFVPLPQIEFLLVKVRTFESVEIDDVTELALPSSLVGVQLAHKMPQLVFAGLQVVHLHGRDRRARGVVLPEEAFLKGDR
jgi:hypothetical protein